MVLKYRIMKHLFILVALVFALGANAQTGVEKNLLSEYGLFNDTITNTGTVYMDVLYSVSSLGKVAIIAKATQLTGTTAGTAILEVSIDGTTYATHPTADTLTLSNGATQAWAVDTEYKKYRINFTGSGTSTTKVEGQYVIK
jgi:hypothetical protein